MPHYTGAAAKLEEVAARLSVFFRGLGGDSGVELKSAIAEVSQHRLSRRSRLGARTERVARARFDGERFNLPDKLDVFPERELNELLYYWLTAWTATGGNEAPASPRDPLMRDLARIGHAHRTTQTALARFPGLAKHYARLRVITLALRPQRALPPVEADVETAIRVLLGATNESSALLSIVRDGERRRYSQDTAPVEYRTYLPVPLWGEIEEGPKRERGQAADDEAGSGKSAGGDGKNRRARRRASDQINRRGGLFVHRFEKILTWTEFMNLHRHVEDDDEDGARKAADDHDEIGVGKLEKKAATRLKIDLDLAPYDVDAERLSDVHTYPEWDFRRQIYLADHTRILERVGEAAAPGAGWEPGSRMEKRIRSVRRQFEALRPKRELLGRQLDGHELDTDALIRSQADMKARGEGSDYVFKQAREQARDLSVAVLIDVSRSTESFVADRPVIDIEREALIALAEGLNACGDEFRHLCVFVAAARPRVRNQTEGI